MSEKLKCSDAIDVSRFVMALMVVLIHADVLKGRFGGVRLPLLRLAVPLFFMISGFLLFRKIGERGGWPRIAAFLKRNATLYAAWFVVLFPIVNLEKSYFANGVGAGLLRILQELLLGATFGSSWYLSALMIGALIVFLLSRKLSNRALLAIGLLVYVICCLTGNYRGLFSDTGPIGWLAAAYPTNMSNSFPVSIVWIVLGKCFADRPNGRPLVAKHRKVVLFAAIVLLFVEELLIVRLGCADVRDCYFMLLLACPLVFDWILTSDLHCAHAKALRETSTIVYCMHFDALKLLAWRLSLSDINVLRPTVGLLMYFVIVAICLFIAYLLRTFSRRLPLLRIFY